MMGRILCCSLWATLVATSGLAADSIFIESVFPPVLRRGEVNRITLQGSQLSGAIGLWTTTADIATSSEPLEVSEQEVTFEVEVSDDASLGLYGLRLATQHGLSNIHLFAIDDLRRVAESEAVESEKSNDRRQLAQDVDLPAAVMGTCTDTDNDYFAIEVAAGQRVSFEVVGNRLGKAFDPVVVIYKNDGEFLLEHDNDVGLFYDCRFEYTFREAGRYIVRVRDTRFQGSEHWTYVLRMGRFPVARVALPSTAKPGQASLIDFPQGKCGPHEIAFPTELTTDRFYYDLRSEEHDAPAWIPLTVSSLDNVVEAEPNDGFESATVATVPCNLHGMLNRRGDEDYFAFELRKGQRLEFRSDTRDSGSAADLELTLLDPQGKAVKTVDDVGFDDASFDFTASASGRHVLKVVEIIRNHGPEYIYRIEVKQRQPRIQLTSEVARLAIPQGTWQPLPLKLDRLDFGGSATLRLLGAPAGMTLRDTSIEAGTKEFTGAIAVDAATPPGLYTLQIELHATDGDTAIRSVARTQPLIDRLPTGRGPHGEPFELSKAQRRLPPSLTDRVAVLVLPPSSFDFEVTPALVTLPRFTHADFQIATTRAPGFAAPIQFVARGGQLEYNRLQMPAITTDIPEATGQQSSVTATLRSGVNTGLTKHRVTVTGTSMDGERTIHLTRTFDLQVKVAFAPSAEPTKLELRPGASAMVRLLANRRQPFQGEVKIRPEETAGLQLDEELVIAADQDGIDVRLTSTADIKPGTYKIKLPSETRIGKFFETGTAAVLEVIVPEQTASEQATSEEDRE